MLTRRVALLVGCLFALTVFAQTPESAQLAPQGEGLDTPPVAIPRPVNLAPASTEAAASKRAARIGTEADLSGAHGDLLLDNATAPASGVLLRALSGTPDIFARLGLATSGASFNVLDANGISLLKVAGNGNATIGATNFGAKLSILGTAANGFGFFVTQRSTVNTTSSQNDVAAYVEAIHDVASGITNTGGIVGARLRGGKVGAGTLANAAGAVVQAGNFSGGGVISLAYGLQAAILAGTGSITTGYGVYIADTEATNDYGIYSIGANDSNYFAGNVIIGGPAPSSPVPSAHALYVTGESYFNGTVTGTNIKAHYQDVAEWVPATTDLSPGTVVVLNRTRNNEVMASASAYDTSVAGVVSAQPGLSLGIEGEGKEQIATTGRVKVRVDARIHPIHVGDLLVTSDVSGTAMLSEPMEINGRKFHQPGTIIGKALEPLAGGIGEILVLLSMQ